MKISQFPAFSALMALAVMASVHAQAPVPVREEPVHKVTLENDYLRMIDVHLAPGKTTLNHIHVIPSVVVNLTNTTILSQEFGQPPATPRTVAPGDVRYAPYDEVPLTHQVTNQSADVFHVLDIELLRAKGNEPWGPVVAEPKLKLAWEQKLVRVYKVQLDAGGACEIPASSRAWLLVDVSGAASTVTRAMMTESPGKLASGEYAFVPPKSGCQFGAAAGASAEFVLLELR
jgi:hypothetical protein